MELRKDYILDRWIIISEGRGKRPSDNVKKEEIKSTSCAFCPGNEAQTPPETMRISDNKKSKKWKIRVIKNKFAAVDLKGNPFIQTHNSYYTFSGDYGDHEIIIETPEHGKNFGELNITEINAILKVYAARIKALQQEPYTKYVALFKNQGREAGASLQHIHSQLISMAMLPPEVLNKLRAIKNYSFCPYCDIINREKNSDRRCFENNNFIAFTPYASRFNYELWIFPKAHIKTFDDLSEAHYTDLADMLKKATSKLEQYSIPYDLAWYYSPENENLHFHVEVMPRIAIWAGFEMGFGIEINTVSPESAAKFYLGEI
jgi:UDPglucose--hexose-1-phosphate uridylyltransferase